MFSIYQYSEASQFLKDALKAKQKTNASFSLRAWARKLGFNGNAPLSLMLAGKRPIPRKYIAHFVDDLGLSPKEARYLEVLIELTHSKSIEERDYQSRRLASVTPKSCKLEKIRWVEIENFRAMGNPLHTFILEMTALKDFKPDPRWIQSRLRIKTTLAEITEAIERLKLLNLLETAGTWKPTHHLITHRPDVADRGSQEYHRRISQLAADQVSLQPVTKREFNSFTFSIREDDLARAKDKLRAFARAFVAEFEAKPGEADHTYQLNSQFFSITEADAYTEKGVKK